MYVVCVRSRSVVALNGGLVSRLCRDCCGSRLCGPRSLHCGGCAVSRVVGIVTARLSLASRQWFRNKESSIQIREEILLEFLRFGHGADGLVIWIEKQWREKQFRTGETNGYRRDQGLVGFRNAQETKKTKCGREDEVWQRSEGRESGRPAVAYIHTARSSNDSRLGYAVLQWKQITKS